MRKERRCLKSAAGAAGKDRERQRRRCMAAAVVAGKSAACFHFIDWMTMFGQGEWLPDQRDKRPATKRLVSERRRRVHGTTGRRETS